MDVIADYNFMVQNIGKKLQNYSIVESYLTNVCTPNTENIHDTFSKTTHEDRWNNLYESRLFNAN
jgi:hypothetical protein